jgi:hypothetical protein
MAKAASPSGAGSATPDEVVVAGTSGDVRTLRSSADARGEDVAVAVERGSRLDMRTSTARIVRNARHARPL